MAQVSIFPDAQAVGEAVAAEIVDGLSAAVHDGRDFLLGAPSGRTPVTTYRALARRLAERPDLDLARLVIVMMDDYAERDPASGLVHRVDDRLPYSCERFGREDIVGAVNVASGSDRLPLHNLLLPDPADPQSYDEEIEARGGIDFFILASGASDGHVAFNPAGSSIDSPTRVVELSVQTRTDNIQTFSPHFRRLEDVPALGVTVGIRTIRRNSRRAVMLALGAEKRQAVARLADARGYDPEWPATVVWECASSDVYVDSAAAPALAEVGGDRHE